MKKILSLFAAVAMVAAVGAAPLTPKALNASDVALSAEQVSAKQTVTGKPSKQALAEQVAVQKVDKSVVKNKLQAKSNAPKAKRAAAQRVAHATKADTVNIIGNRIALQEYYEEDGDQYVAFWNTDETVLVRLDYISESFTGTFTTEDFDMDYTYLTDYSSGSKEYIEFDSLVAVITETPDFTDIQAIGRDEAGTIYSIKMHHDVIRPKDTVNLVFTQVMLDAFSDDYFQFEGIDGQKSVSLIIAYNNGGIAGEYTTSDFYPVSGWFSGFAYTDQETNTWVDYVEAEAVITMADRVYDINASMIGNDSLLYNVKMTYALPAPADTIDIAINNLESVDLTYWLGAFWLQGNNTEYNVSLTVAADAMEVGTYNVESASVINTLLADTVSVSDATVDISFDEAGSVVADAKVYSNDNILYRIAMAFVVPEPVDTLAISFEHSAELFHLTDYGEYGMENMDEHYIAAAYVYSDVLEGTFEGEDFDRYYSGIGIINGTDTTLIPVMAGKVTLTQKEDSTLMYAEMIGEDSILYQVSMFYVLPEPKAVVEIVVPEAEMTNLLADGLYQLHGFTADEVYYISIVPESDEVEGEFEVSDLNSKYSAIQYYDENTELVTVTFLSGSVKATMSADSIITMQGELLASDTILYKVTLTGKFAEEDKGLEYDAKEGQVDITYAADEIAFTTDYVAEDGDLYVRLTSGTNYASIGFYIGNTLDPDITIPAGTYNIDNSGDMGTVMACEGVVDGSIYPSFFGQLSSQGIGQPIFFFVSGTVVVENRNGFLYFEVNAKNSYDRPIHIIYSAAGATAVENTTVKAAAARKTVENGQLVILRGNDKFNVFGTKIQ